MSSVYILVHLEADLGLDTQSTGGIVGSLVRESMGCGDGDLVAGIAGRIRGVAVNGEQTLQDRDSDLLAVSASFNEDALRRGRAGAQGVDRLLDGRVFARATNSESTRWSAGTAGCKCEGRKGEDAS